MPNDCWNRMTVTGTEEDVGRFFVEEFKDVPEWAYEIYVKGVEGIQIRAGNRTLRGSRDFSRNIRRCG